MAISKLDPKTALIVIDLQKGIVSRELAHPVPPVVANAAKLAAAWRTKGLPVVLVNVAGGAPGRTEQQPNMGQLPADWAELTPELNKQPNDHLVTKHTWGAFTKTDLESYLKSKGVTEVVLCGIATSIGVESTARYAHELGLNVALVTDAMTDMNIDAHNNSVSRIFPRMGETGSTQDIIGLLA